MSTRENRMPEDYLPDARDGLTRLDRVILWVLSECEREYGSKRVPSAEVYGRVVEHMNVSVQEFQRALKRLTGG